MNIRKLMRMSVVAVLLAGTAALAAEDLERGFQAPPDSARPWVYWFWMNGNITREGITADLEAMQRVGIRGALIMDVASPQAPLVEFGSPGWHALLKFAVEEARRLGLEIELHNAPSWAGSGGPWITPENAMKVVVTSEKRVQGPGRFEEVLPQPPSNLGFYRDVAVLAFRTPATELARMSDLAPKVTVSTPGEDGAKLPDGQETPVKVEEPKPGFNPFIQFEFAQPYTAGKLNLKMAPDFWHTGGQLEVSQDGKDFKPVTKFALSGRERPEDVFGFTPVCGKFFRILFTNGSTGTSARKYLGVIKAELTPQIGILGLKEKLFRSRGWGTYEVPPTLTGPAQGVVASDSLVDLSAKMGSDGKLTWEIPEGSWTLLRVGYTANGKLMAPAPHGGEGLVCDNLSRKAAQVHWDAHMRRIVENLGPLAGNVATGLNNVEIDSYESRCQNWTDGFEQEFQQRRGYGLLKFLPVLTGRVVDSPEVTERFLWDFRRTVTDLFNERYVGQMAAMAHEAGLRLSIEPYGNGAFDDSEYARYADIPMSEFWGGPGAGGGPLAWHRPAPSAGHVYGRKIIGAEAFTSNPAHGRWTQDPYALKACGDYAYCEGVNRCILSCYPHQPWLTRAPGMTLGPWGAHFGRTITWWEQGREWMSYMARCQYLLQQGRFVADVLFYSGEGTPNSVRKGELPIGYDYDGCATDAVMSLKVQNGRLVLPSGMSYRVLALPPDRTMTPAVLEKIKTLVEAGATVVGLKPEASPSLAGYPQCDQQVRKLAEEIWPRVKANKAPEALKALGVQPDFECSSAKVTYIHRKLNDGADIYFVASPEEKSQELECTFRVSGKQPEFWHPDTGRIEPVPGYVEKEGRTTVPVRLDPVGSVFVIFRKPVEGDHVVAVKRTGGQGSGTAELSEQQDGKLAISASEPGTFELTMASGKSLKAEVSEVPKPVELAGPWELSFPPNWGAPEKITMEKLISWTEHPDKGVKYFSGTGTYRKSFDYEVPGANCRVFLDLGELKNLAELKLNGKDLGILWKPPYREEVTGLLKPTGNELEIKVTNLWPNRMIGDEQLPEDREWGKKSPWNGGLTKVPQWVIEGKPSPTGRFTFATYHHWGKEDPLLPSGLFGPVRLVTISVTTFPVK